MIPILYKAIAAVSIMAALALAATYLHHRIYQAGYDDAERIYQKREAALSAQAQKRFEAAMHDAQEQADLLTAELHAIDQRRTKEQANADETVKRLRADIAAGHRRLSIPITSTCAVPAGATAGSAGTVARVEPEARADIDPATADALVGIAADGDSAIRQLNAVIDAYTAVQAMCSHQPETTQ